MRESRDSIQAIWGERTPFKGEGFWPERVDEKLSEEPDRWVQSACVLCSNGCGVEVGVKEGRLVGVRGRATDVVNRGRLGRRALTRGRPTTPDRLTRPLYESAAAAGSELGRGDGLIVGTGQRHSRALYGECNRVLYKRATLP